MAQKRSLTEGNVYKTLISFSIPFMLAQLLQALYGAVDLMVVGQFGQTADVSAVSMGSQIMYVASFFILGFASAVTVVMGQYFGAKQEKKLSKTMGAAVVFFLAAGLLLMAVMIVFRHSIVRLMNTPPEAVSPALDYILVCSFGLPLVGGYNVVCGILRGLGDSKTPLLFVAIACVINIVLDIILVRNFGLGAWGAAFATSFAQGMSFLFSLLYLKKRGLGFPFTFRDIGFHWEQVRAILRIGTPMVLQNSLTEISFLLITMIINGMGVVVSAAVGVVGKLVSFLFIPTIGMSTAVAAMCAQNYGAGQYRRARQCMKGAILFSGALGIAATVCSLLFGSHMLRLFTSDPEVLGHAVLYLQSYSFDCILVAVVFNMNGYFNGFGRSFFTMAHNLAATFLGRIPLTFLFSRLPGVTLREMGIAVPVSTLISVILCLWYLRRMNRQLEAAAKKRTQVRQEGGKDNENRNWH